MTYEEKKKLAEAVKVLKENCNKMYSTGTCVGCDFFNENKRDCDLYNFPTFWETPTIPRWTPEDVALAKALKEFGTHGFYKNVVKGDVFWMDGKGNSAKLPKGCLTALENGTEILIDTIISEAAEA